jgi:hypothetical protein
MNYCANQGIKSTERRARQLVYWLGLHSDITIMVRVCEICQKEFPSDQRELLDPSPSRVFEDIFIDIFCHASNLYLMYANRWSGWHTVFEFVKHDLCFRNVIR